MYKNYNNNTAIPVWPLVLSIIFLVISFVAAVCSITIFLSMFMVPVGIISLIFSIISITGARKNEKTVGRNGVSTGARVIGIISCVLSSISIIIGTIMIITTLLHIIPTHVSQRAKQSPYPSYSYSYPTDQYNQDSTNTGEEDKIEPLSLAASKIKIFKYNMAVTENGQLLCWNWYNYRGNRMLSTSVPSDSTPYGIGILGRVEKEYLHISEISFDTWENEIILTETTTFKPQGEILYITSNNILYQKNGKLQLIVYEKGTGSVLFDLPVMFVLKQGQEITEIGELSFDGVYREYTEGHYTYDNYNAISGSLTKYRLSFLAENGKKYYGSLQKYNSAWDYGHGGYEQKDDCVKIYVYSEIIDSYSGNPQLYITYEEGTLSENIDSILQGHIRDKDKTHLYISSVKDDLKIILPDGYTIDDIAGISISNDAKLSIPEWTIPESEKLVVCMIDNTFYYNASASSVKGVDLEPYTELNKAIKEKGVIRIIRMSHTWYAIDRDENLYEVNLIK